MDEHESRVSQLLHNGVPEPRLRLRGAQIRALDNLDQTRSVRPPRRWVLPLLAAVVVLLVGATTAAVLLLNTSKRAGPAAPIGPVGTTAVASTGLSPTAASPSGSSTASPSPSGSSAAAPTTCRTDQLQLTVAGATDGTAGTSYTPFSLTNTTTTTSCLMQGYPGVSLLDPAGAIVGQPATRVGAAGNTITVPAGGAATFTVGVNDVTQLGCQTPRPSTQIQVYPPNQTTALRIPFTTGSCALTVTSVTRAS